MSELSSSPLSDAGFNDPVKGAELFSLIGASIDDLRDPAMHAKFAEIASFLAMGDEAFELVRRVVIKGGRGYDALEKAFQYSKLQKERIGLRQKISSIEKELAIYE